MMFIKEIFLGREKLFTPNIIIFHGALLVMSFAFVYVFSYSTSFAYDLLGGDSAIFQVVGKYWTQGYLPYVDLFDHKGPLIFFINAIGYMIYPRSGIMVPQIISLYLSCLFIWRALELYWSGFPKIFFFLITLIFHVNHYQGNFTEEYSLPFLSATTYLFLSFLKSFKQDTSPPLPKFFGLIYGIGFGACVLLRASNAMPLCCFVFLSAIFLIQARDFKALRQNVLNFLAGFVIICLPFIIYFAAHGALYDMLYGTILYNLKYALHDPYHSEKFNYMVYIFLNLTPLILLIAMSFFGLVENFKDKLFWSGLFVGTMLFFMLSQLRQYTWYCDIITPIMPFIFALLYKITKGAPDDFKNFWRARRFSPKRLLLKFAIIFFVPSVIFYSWFYSKVFIFPLLQSDFKNIDKKAVENSLEIAELKKIIPYEESSSFMTWGLNAGVACWSLKTGLLSRSRFFGNLSALGRIDPNIRQEWFQKFYADPPLWFLYGGKLLHESSGILIPPEDLQVERILDEKYIYKGEATVGLQKMKLYRLKE